MTETNKVTRGTVVGITFGEVAYQVIMAVQSLLLVYFLYNFSGIPGTNIAAVILIAGTWDAINDPLMGMIVDRTNTKMGKARPYILFGSFPLALCVLALFFIPVSMTVMGKTIWVGIAYIGYVTFRTVVSVPYATMLVRVTDSRDDRMRITKSKTIFSSFGGIAVTLSYSMIAAGKANEGDLIAVLVASALVFYVISNAVLFCNTKEIPRLTDSQKLNPLKGLKVVFTNKYWVLLTLACMSYGIQGTIKSGTMVFYLTSKFNAAWMLTPITIMSLILAVASAITARELERKLGLRKVAMVGGVIAVCGGLLRVVTMDANLVVYTISIALNQIGFAFFFISIAPFLADVVEYGELKKGTRVEALTSSSRTFADKMATTVITSFIAFMLEVSGYISASSSDLSLAEIVQPESAMNMLFNLSAVVPIFMAVAIFVIMAKFNVREEVDNLRAEKAETITETVEA